MNFELNFGPGRPDEREMEVWAEAQRLVAASLGGRAIYAEELRNRFGGQKSVGPDDVSYLLTLIHALVQLSTAVIHLMTMAGDDYDELREDLLDGVKGDPQALLALIDRAAEEHAQGEKGDLAEPE
jgi:hypothetical protein